MQSRQVLGLAIAGGLIFSFTCSYLSYHQGKGDGYNMAKIEYQKVILDYQEELTQTVDETEEHMAQATDELITQYQRGMEMQKLVDSFSLKLKAGGHNEQSKEMIELAESVGNAEDKETFFEALKKLTDLCSKRSE